MKFGFACLTVTIRCYSFAYKNYNKVCYVSQLRFYFLEIIAHNSHFLYKNILFYVNIFAKDIFI